MNNWEGQRECIGFAEACPVILTSLWFFSVRKNTFVKPSALQRAGNIMWQRHHNPQSSGPEAVHTPFLFRPMYRCSQQHPVKELMFLSKDSPSSRRERKTCELTIVMHCDNCQPRVQNSGKMWHKELPSVFGERIGKESESKDLSAPSEMPIIRMPEKPDNSYCC